MVPVATLRRCAQEALAYLRAQPNVAEAEVFVAANAHLIARLNYTSHIPSNGVEEPKSVSSLGLGVRVAFRDADALRVGFGAEPSDLSLQGVRRALDKARRGAVHDPQFFGLPRPGAERRTLRRYHDPAVMRLRDGALVAAGWQVVEAALHAWETSETLAEAASDPTALARLGLILGGDVVALQERVAIASSHLPRVETDESTLLLSFATAMVEERQAKGSAWSVGVGLAGFQGQAGAEAARNAVRQMGGQRVPDGEYRVLLGPQPVTDLLLNIVLPGLRADTFYAGASPFQGRLGKQVAAPVLSVEDRGAQPGLAGTKAITDEGLPTGRTPLIAGGRLVGLLTNYYETQRLLHDPRAAEKLGAHPRSIPQALVPRNGFRAGRGGGRSFETVPGIAATNLVVEGSPALTHQELLQQVGDGLYLGRIWYTYPINGLAAGDFTATVVGDSYRIRDGRLAGPVRANSVRISGNIHDLLRGVLGVGCQRWGTVPWASDEVVWAPEVAVEAVQVRAIGAYLDELLGPRA